MAGKTLRKITDRKMFQSVFLKLFLNTSVFIKKDNDTVPASFLSYDAGIATIRIPPGHDFTGQIVVFVERQKDVVFSHMNFIASAGKDTYTFDALDIQIMEFVKSEEAPEQPAPEVRRQPRIGQLYLSDIISDVTLSECLKNNSRRVEYMRDEIGKKLKAVYPHSVISFLHDKKPNHRMDFFQSERRPYFFPELKKPLNHAENKDLSFFMSNIYSSDFSLSDNHYESEICVPILYKLMMPFGYIQVNSPRPLAEKDYSVIRKLGMSASVIFTNDQRIIKSSADIISIADVSEGGLGIVFREKPLIKHFRENSMVSFNIYFPDNKKAAVLARICHISLIDNKIYKVGTQIVNIDPIGEVYYTDYIEAAGGQKTEAP